MKMKNFSNGFCYRVVEVLKALWIVLSETINILRTLHKTNIFGMPSKILPSSYVLSPSSGHVSLNCNMPFELILRRFEVVFWCLECECCTFWKIDKFIQIHQWTISTMALNWTHFCEFGLKCLWDQYLVIDKRLFHNVFQIIFQLDSSLSLKFLILIYRL